MTGVQTCALPISEDNILPAADSDFRDRRILLVEDNELNSEIAVALLSEYGFQVDTAEDRCV